MQKKEIITTFYQYDSSDQLDLTDKELTQKAMEAAQRSYSPYSHFRVGAAVRLENGTIVQGNNQENSAYPSGLCAERVAIFYANSKYPDIPVTAIAIAACTEEGFLDTPIPPCGSCRQVLLETEERFGIPIKMILYGQDHIRVVNEIKQLLPLHFDKGMLK